MFLVVFRVVTVQVRGLTTGIEFLFKKNGVEYIKGAASFETDHILNAQLLSGGERKIEADNIILATGSCKFIECLIDDVQLAALCPISLSQE